MTMTLSLHDSIDPNSALLDISISSPSAVRHGSRPEIHLLEDKLRMPAIDGLVDRERLSALLEKSTKSFPATLLTGRAGTGKTYTVAGFVAGKENTAWYRLESTDVEWPSFSKYFSAALGIDADRRTRSIDPEQAEKEPSQQDIAHFLVTRFTRAYGRNGEAPEVIVLDDIHHIFDAPWFEEFFNLLLYSLPPEAHLILMCRSKPPSPLWRLRSKQILNVIDEKVLAFTEEEAATLFDMHSLPKTRLKEACRATYGRASKMLEFAGGSIGSSELDG